MAHALLEMTTVPRLRADHVRQRRGVRRAGAGPGHPGAVAVRAPHAAVRRASPTSATCPATGSSGCPSSPAWSTFHARRPQTQERLTKQIADHLSERLQPARGRRRDRGRAHLHEPARRPGAAAPGRSPRRCSGAARRPAQPAPSSSRSPGAADEHRRRRRAAWPARTPSRSCASRGTTATSPSSARSTTCPTSGPPLSKGLLLGTDEPDVAVRPRRRSGTPSTRVDLRTGTPVDRRSTSSAARVTRRRIDELAYDRLLLATGAAAAAPCRWPTTAGCRRPLPAHPRRLAGAQGAASTGHVLVIVGAGWIGLEVAAAARAGRRRGHRRRAPPRCRCAAVLGPEVAAVFADLHREHGVDLRLETVPRSTRGRPDASRSPTARPGPRPGRGRDRRRARRPLAARAGLATDNGVLVDARLRTGDPHVFAAGDVANHDHPVLGRLRVEHWDNAHPPGQARRPRDARRRRGRTSACRTSSPTSTTSAWSTSATSAADGYDEVVVRGRPAPARVFTAFWVTHGRVVAGMHVNDWDAIDDLRAVVGSEATDLVRDPAVALADLA